MKGDTLFYIAAYLDLGACDIVAANNIKDPNTIVVGTLLKVPAATEKGPRKSYLSAIASTEGGGCSSPLLIAAYCNL